MEVSGYLVGSAAFKAVETGDPRLAGSIPVHLRQKPRAQSLVRPRNRAFWSQRENSRAPKDRADRQLPRLDDLATPLGVECHCVVYCGAVNTETVRGAIRIFIAEGDTKQKF